MLKLAEVLFFFKLLTRFITLLYFLSPLKTPFSYSTSPLITQISLYFSLSTFSLFSHSILSTFLKFLTTFSQISHFVFLSRHASLSLSPILCHSIFSHYFLTIYQSTFSLHFLPPLSLFILTPLPSQLLFSYSTFSLHFLFSHITPFI